MTKAKEVSDVLRSRGLKLCLAESFTGGGLASAFIELPGASDILASSLVCYALEAKVKLLGVSRETLAKYGAVSAQTIAEMLDGLAKLKLGDIMVATSGNAGPTSEKPDEVGRFYLGVMIGDKKTIKEYKVSGNRDEIIKKGVCEALELIAEALKTN